jgi:hypothetical protein
LPTVVPIELYATFVALTCRLLLQCPSDNVCKTYIHVAQLLDEERDFSSLLLAKSGTPLQ